ncbi:MAG: hypothetical protein ACD_21C00225G0003 [uncultured bacterium]|nr:MAG: hypothetical protein ACD_21C00225G0003 [uncultured bacterium]
MKTIASRLMLVAGLLTTVAACNSTSVIPQTGGLFTVITTASNQEEAVKLAMIKSQDICGQYGNKPKLIDQEIKYQGIDKTQQKLVKFAQDLLPQSKTAGPYTPADHEYKATLAFKCE